MPQASSSIKRNAVAKSPPPQDWQLGVEVRNYARPYLDVTGSQLRSQMKAFKNELESLLFVLIHLIP